MYIMEINTMKKLKLSEKFFYQLTAKIETELADWPKCLEIIMKDAKEINGKIIEFRHELHLTKQGNELKEIVNSYEIKLNNLSMLLCDKRVTLDYFMDQIMDACSYSIGLLEEAELEQNSTKFLKEKTLKKICQNQRILSKSTLLKNKLLDYENKIKETQGLLFQCREHVELFLAEIQICMLKLQSSSCSRLKNYQVNISNVSQTELSEPSIKKYLEDDEIKRDPQIEEIKKQIIAQIKEKEIQRLLNKARCQEIREELEKSRLESRRIKNELLEKRREGRSSKIKCSCDTKQDGKSKPEKLDPRNLESKQDTLYLMHEDLEDEYVTDEKMRDDPLKVFPQDLDQDYSKVATKTDDMLKSKSQKSKQHRKKGHHHKSKHSKRSQKSKETSGSKQHRKRTKKSDVNSEDVTSTVSESREETNRRPCSVCCKETTVAAQSSMTTSETEDIIPLSRERSEESKEVEELSPKSAGGKKILPKNGSLLKSDGSQVHQPLMRKRSPRPGSGRKNKSKSHGKPVRRKKKKVMKKLNKTLTDRAQSEEEEIVEEIVQQKPSKYKYPCICLKTDIKKQEQKEQLTNIGKTASTEDIAATKENEITINQNLEVGMISAQKSSVLSDQEKEENIKTIEYTKPSSICSKTDIRKQEYIERNIQHSQEILDYKSISKEDVDRKFNEDITDDKTGKKPTERILSSTSKDDINKQEKERTKSERKDILSCCKTDTIRQEKNEKNIQSNEGKFGEKSFDNTILTSPKADIDKETNEEGTAQDKTGQKSTEKEDIKKLENEEKIFGRKSFLPCCMSDIKKHENIQSSMRKPDENFIDKENLISSKAEDNEGELTEGKTGQRMTGKISAASSRIDEEPFEGRAGQKTTGKVDKEKTPGKKSVLSCCKTDTKKQENVEKYIQSRGLISSQAEAEGVELIEDKDGQKTIGKVDAEDVEKYTGRGLISSQAEANGVKLIEDKAGQKTIWKVDEGKTPLKKSILPCCKTDTIKQKDVEEKNLISFKVEDNEGELTEGKTGQRMTGKISAASSRIDEEPFEGRAGQKTTGKISAASSRIDEEPFEGRAGQKTTGKVDKEKTPGTKSVLSCCKTDIKKQENFEENNKFGKNETDQKFAKKENNEESISNIEEKGGKKATPINYQTDGIKKANEQKKISNKGKLPLVCCKSNATESARLVEDYVPGETTKINTSTDELQNKDMEGNTCLLPKARSSEDKYDDRYITAGQYPKNYVKIKAKSKNESEIVEKQTCYQICCEADVIEKASGKLSQSSYAESEQSKDGEYLSEQKRLKDNKLDQSEQGLKKQFCPCHKTKVSNQYLDPRDKSRVAGSHDSQEVVKQKIGSTDSQDGADVNTKKLVTNQKSTDGIINKTNEEGKKQEKKMKNDKLSPCCQTAVRNDQVSSLSIDDLSGKVKNKSYEASGVDMNKEDQTISLSKGVKITKDDIVLLEKEKVKEPCFCGKNSTTVNLKTNLEDNSAEDTFIKVKIEDEPKKLASNLKKLSNEQKTKPAKENKLGTDVSANDLSSPAPMKGPTGGGCCGSKATATETKGFENKTIGNKMVDMKADETTKTTTSKPNKELMKKDINQDGEKLETDEYKNNKRITKDKAQVKDDGTKAADSNAFYLITHLPFICCSTMNTKHVSSHVEMKKGILGDQKVNAANRGEEADRQDKNVLFKNEIIKEEDKTKYDVTSIVDYIENSEDSPKKKCDTTTFENDVLYDLTQSAKTDSEIPVKKSENRFCCKTKTIPNKAYARYMDQLNKDEQLIKNGKVEYKKGAEDLTKQMDLIRYSRDPTMTKEKILKLKKEEENRLRLLEIKRKQLKARSEEENRKTEAKRLQKRNKFSTKCRSKRRNQYRIRNSNMNVNKATDSVNLYGNFESNLTHYTDKNGTIETDQLVDDFSSLLCDESINSQDVIINMHRELLHNNTNNNNSKRNKTRHHEVNETSKLIVRQKCIKPIRRILVGSANSNLNSKSEDTLNMAEIDYDNVQKEKVGCCVKKKVVTKTEQKVATMNKQGFTTEDDSNKEHFNEEAKDHKHEAGELSLNENDEDEDEEGNTYSKEFLDIEDYSEVDREDIDEEDGDYDFEEDDNSQIESDSNHISSHENKKLDQFLKEINMIHFEPDKEALGETTVEDNKDQLVTKDDSKENTITDVDDNVFPINESDPDNPKFWPTYIYHMKPENSRKIVVTCVVRGMKGCIKNKRNIIPKLVPPKRELPNLDLREDVVSRLFEIKPRSEDIAFQFEPPWRIIIPHIHPKHSQKEIEIFQLTEENVWQSLEIFELPNDDLKELKVRLVETRTNKPFGVYAVVTKTRVEKTVINKQGERISSSIDSRTFVTVPPGAVRITMNTLLRVNTIDNNFWKEIKAKDKPPLDSIICSSHLIDLVAPKKKLIKPASISCFLPINPEVKKQAEAAVKAAKRTSYRSDDDSDRQTTTTTSSIAKDKPRLEMDSFQKSLMSNGIGGVTANEKVIMLCYNEDDEKWSQLNDVNISSDKTKEQMTIEIKTLQSFKFMLVRAKKTATPEDLNKASKSIEFEFSVRNCVIVLLKSNQNPHKFLLLTCIKSRYDKLFSHFKDHGYSLESHNLPVYLELKERQILALKLTGNVELLNKSSNTMYLSYQTFYQNAVEFMVREISSYAQRAIDHYRGYLKIFSKVSVKKVIENTDPKARKGILQYHWVEEDTLICSLLIKIPKTSLKKIKPFKNVVINRETMDTIVCMFSHICDEIGLSYKDLAHALHISESRMQMIERHNPSQVPGKITGQLLMFWLKGMLLMDDKFEILHAALVEIGRGDLACQLQNCVEDKGRTNSLVSI